ncbi:MAG: DEAD/DEAH box helicase [Eubacteriales bacterium]|nr:DEAD/DEAH box helicase [Eubacteriales bacterium]
MTFTPYNYQQYCADRVVADKNVGLFIDMGLGKTASTLLAIEELKYRRFEVDKVLVIAPKKVAEATWQNEIQKWDNFSYLTVSTILGNKKQRINALLREADIYITNRDNVVWLVDYCVFELKRWPFDMVVLDESSSFKNPRAKRFKALASIRGHIDRIVELSGTPAPQDIGDLWSQVYLLDGGARLGDRIGAFKQRFCEVVRVGNRFVYGAFKPGADEFVRKQIGDICISMRAEDYLELPDLVYNIFPVELDKKSARAYKELEKKMLLEVDGEEISVTSAATLSNKLLQLCNGAIYDEEKNIHEIHECKLEALEELLEGLQGSHALVFYAYKHDRDRILSRLSGKYRVRVYSDAEDADAWNAGRVDVLLAHPASTAYGLNLQHGGHNIVWFGLNWSLELYQQANARLYRQGQTDRVVVHHLAVQGGLDQDVLGALDNKKDTQDALLAAIKARVEHAKKGG